MKLTTPDWSLHLDGDMLIWTPISSYGDVIPSMAITHVAVDGTRLVIEYECGRQRLEVKSPEIDAPEMEAFARAVAERAALDQGVATNRIAP